MQKNTNRWSYFERTVTQIVPVIGINAVFAMETEKAGKYKLEAEPIQFLALVSEVEVFMERCGPRAMDTRETGREEPRWNISALVMHDGFFDLASEADNFAGIQLPGMTLEQCTGYLRGTWDFEGAPDAPARKPKPPTK